METIHEVIFVVKYQFFIEDKAVIAKRYQFVPSPTKAFRLPEFRPVVKEWPDTDTEILRYCGRGDNHAGNGDIHLETGYIDRSERLDFEDGIYKSVHHEIRLRRPFGEISKDELTSNCSNSIMELCLKRFQRNSS